MSAKEILPDSQFSTQRSIIEESRALYRLARIRTVKDALRFALDFQLGVDEFKEVLILQGLSPLSVTAVTKRMLESRVRFNVAAS